LSGPLAGYRTPRGRYEDLIDKRDGEGLTDEEATELGRLIAERRGEPYEGDAQDPPPDVELRRRSVPEDEIEEELAEDRPVGPKGTEPSLTSKEPETAPEGGQGPPPA
jgi:hypothetical protein